MLADDGIISERIELDAVRREYIQDPKYTDVERDSVYEKLVDLAAGYVQNGANVIIDATAHKRLYREMARKRIERFIEVFISCPLSICIERETERKEGLVMAQMYRQALVRKEKGVKPEGLGEVIGVDVLYEENPDAEITVDNSSGSALKNAQTVKDAIVRHYYHAIN